MLRLYDMSTIEKGDSSILWLWPFEKELEKVFFLSRSAIFPPDTRALSHSQNTCTPKGKLSAETGNLKLQLAFGTRELGGVLLPLVQ